MVSERIIKSRIKSAKNIAQITNAMQMVAASKMRRAQVKALSGKPYADKIVELISKFAPKLDEQVHRILKVNQQGKRLFIIISTSKGLCGGLNTNLFRYLLRIFDKKVYQDSLFVTIGKKGEWFILNNQWRLQADFSDYRQVEPIIGAVTQLIVEGYINQEIKEAYLVFNSFVSALIQQPIHKLILPVRQVVLGNQSVNRLAAEDKRQYLVEPNIPAVVNQLLVHFLENQIRAALLEAEASEHSARMMAMKNATDNAQEFIEVLSLEYNKARQQKITYEIADMVTARLAVRE